MIFPSLTLNRTLIIFSFILLFCSFFVESVALKGNERAFSDYPSETIEKFWKNRFPYPLHTPAFYFVAWGDIMLSRNIGYYNKKYGYDRIFGSWTYHPIAAFPDCVPENCLLFFNLESLFHPRDNDIQLWGFNFRANTGNITTLLQLMSPPFLSHSQNTGNIDGNERLPLLLSLANNHTVNGGYEGILTTKQLLQQHDILSLGAGTTPDEAKMLLVSSGNVKLCFQAYSYDGKQNLKVWWGTITRNPLNEQTILQDLEKMTEMDCDVKILSLHRGREYRFAPNQRQKDLAHTFIDKGADLILGGHSHIPGKYEIYKGKYIFYSLGNFIFDQGRGKKATGSEFDYIFDTTLKRKTVPTYIAMLLGLKIYKIPSQKEKNRILIKLDHIAMTTTTDGIHSPLDPQTTKEIISSLFKEEK